MILTARGTARRGQSFPKAPPDMKDAVETWARQWGRHGSLVWDPRADCFVIELTLLEGDKRKLLNRRRSRGVERELLEDARDERDKKALEPKERVHLHEWRSAEEMERVPYFMQKRHPRTNLVRAGYVAINLGELGIGGLLEMLDRGNTFTGRGEYDSISDAVRAMSRKRVEAEVRAKKDAEASAVDRAMDIRKQLLGIPTLPGAEFTAEEPTTAPENDDT